MRRRHSSRLSSQGKNTTPSSEKEDSPHARRRSTRKNYKLTFPEFDDESPATTASRRTRSTRYNNIKEEEEDNREEEYSVDEDDEEEEEDTSMQLNEEQENEEIVPRRGTRHSKRISSGRIGKVATPRSPQQVSRRGGRKRGGRRGRGRIRSSTGSTHQDIKNEDEESEEEEEKEEQSVEEEEEKEGEQSVEEQQQKEEKENLEEQKEEEKVEINEGSEKEKEDKKEDEPQEAVVVPVKRGRGRPPKYKPGTKRYIAPSELKKRRSANSNTGSTRFNGKREVATTFPIPLDENGKEYDVNKDGDEYDIRDDEDEEGNKKIDKLGYLQGNRDFRVRTFTVPGQGEKLYMLSTEPARCLGYRDAYYLFLRHPTLYKFILTMDEKQDLVDRGIMPNSYKSRTIGLVTARSVFKEFGARIIIGGRYIIDDYKVSKMKEDKDIIEGALATPDDFVPINKIDYDKKKYIAWYGGSQIYQKQQNLQFVAHHHSSFNDSSDSLFKKTDSNKSNTGNGLLNNDLVPNSVHKYLDFPMHKPFKIKCEFSDSDITEQNWIYENSNASRIYNHDLIEKRLSTMEEKYLGENGSTSLIAKKTKKHKKAKQSKHKENKDFLTGITFVPSITQPKACQWFNITTTAEQRQNQFNAHRSINFNNWSNGITFDNSGHTNNSLIYETCLNMKINGRNVNTAEIKLKDVNLKIFEDCVSSDIKEAILNQQRLERGCK